MDRHELHADGLPKILPAYENGVFQAMLTLPEAEEALISAVSAFLDRPVKSVTLRDSTAPKRHVSEKFPGYDINCVVDDKDGDQCEIEMQASRMRDDSGSSGHKNIRWRSALYLSRLHSGQDGKGKSYSSFARSYQIMLCNYRVFGRKQALVERFTLRNKNGTELCDAITSIFIDLTKARVIAKKLVSEMAEVEMWTAFIALANNPDYTGLIGEITKRMEGIAVANTTLQNISQDQDERIRYYRRAKALQDEEHNKAIDKANKERVKEIKRLERKIADGKRRNAEAERKVEDGKRRNAEAKRKNAEAEREIEDARREIAAAESEYAKIKAENAELRARLAAVDAGGK